MTREEAISLLHDMKDTYDEIHENTNYEIGYEQMTALDMAIEALSAVSREDTVTLNSPISIQADMVEVVRCKDCRHCEEYYDTDGYPYWICDEWDSGIDADGFCYHGERREK